MTKRISIILSLSILSMPLFGASIDKANNQQTHLQTQIKKVTLSWQRTEITLNRIKKLLPLPLYQQAENTAQKILSLTDVNSKMRFLLNTEENKIIKDQKQYSAINFLSSYFPQIIKKLNSTMQAICIAMGNKSYRQDLGITTINKLIQSI